MHSYDRTLLAKLGFADPDRANSRHDLACQYIAQPPNVDKLIGLLALAYPLLPFRTATDSDECIGMHSSAIHHRWTSYEVPIEKGSDQYKTTIGFMDVMLGFELLKHQYQVHWRRRDWPGAPWGQWREEKESRLLSRYCAGVEVKIAPVPVGSLIRQVNLYRSYTPHVPYGDRGIARWVVVTDYGISAADHGALGNEKILHVRLGPDFDAFVASQHEPAAQMMSPEI